MKLASLLFSSLLFGLASALAASEAGYDRAVMVEWEAIPGAESYDVEWFTGTDCSKSGGKDVSRGTSWKTRLAGGSYCVRVRAVAADDKAGQWTDFQRLDVKPKPPRSLTREGDTFIWDKVPYATDYEVEVLDAAGKVVFKKSSKESELELDDKFFREKKLARDRVQVRVRTRVDGVESSVPSKAMTYPEFGLTPAQAAAAKAKANAVEAGKPPGPPPPRPPLEAGPQAAVERLRKFAAAQPSPTPVEAQPLAGALEADEAVSRFTLVGEKPLPPTVEEWAKAKTEADKDRLRRRSIASQRVELVERIEERRPPQFGFTLFTGAGPANDSTRIGDGSLRDHRGVAPTMRFEFSLNRERPWGYFLEGSFNPTHVAKSSTFLSGSLGVERSMWLDASGDAVLRFGVGFGIMRTPLPIDTIAPAFVYQLDGWGPVMRAGFDYRLSPIWRATAFASFSTLCPGAEVERYFPGGDNYGRRSELRLGLVAKAWREWELGGGLYFFKHQGTVVTQDSAAERTLQLMGTGVYAQATYLVGSLNGRDPAAETRVELDAEKLWQARLDLSSDWRSGVLNNTEITLPTPRAGLPAEVQGGALGFDVALKRRWSNRSPLWFSLRHGSRALSVDDKTRSERIHRVGAGGEWLMFGRRDIWFRAAVLGFFRKSVGISRFEDAGITHEVSSTMSVYGLEPELSIEKAWGSRFKGEATLGLGLPFAVASTPQPTVGSSWSRTGRNFFWRFDLGGAYRLSEGWAALLSYGLEVQRYTLEGDVGDLSLTPTQVLDSQAHRVGLGIQFSW